MSAPQTRSRVSPTLLVLAAAVLWSTGGLGIKEPTGSAMALAGYRSLFALPVLMLATKIESGRRGVHVAEMARRPLVWAAAGSYAVMVVAFVVSDRMTSAANAILLQYSGPIYVALLSWPLLRERIRPIDWIATGACFGGMVLFFVGKLSHDARIGNLVAIVSSFGFAGVPLMMRREQRSRPATWQGDAASPFVAMTIGNGLAVLACAPWMIAYPLRGWSWVVVFGLGVVQIGAAYWLYGAAVGKMPALRSTLLATIEPVLNPVWVAIFKAERPSAWAMVGGAMILAAVTGQAIVSRREKATEARNASSDRT